MRQRSDPDSGDVVAPFGGGPTGVYELSVKRIEPIPEVLAVQDINEILEQNETAPTQEGIAHISGRDSTLWLVKRRNRETCRLKPLSFCFLA